MIHGSIVALITPFRDGKLDEDALRKMVAWHVEQGTDGVVPVGTTGECPTLTPEEHCRVIEITAEIAKGKMTINLSEAKKLGIKFPASVLKEAKAKGVIYK